MEGREGLGWNMEGREMAASCCVEIPAVGFCAKYV